MLGPYQLHRVIQQSFFHQELVPQDRAFQEQRGRCSTFHPRWTGRPLVMFTPFCLCNSHLQWCHVDIYLFIFLCCKSHLAEQPWMWALHPFLLLPLQVTSGSSCESSVSISAESHWHRPRKEATPLRQGKKANSSVFSEIYAAIVHGSCPQTTGVVVTTPSTKLFLLGPSASRVWISNFQAVASWF